MVDAVFAAMPWLMALLPMVTLGAAGLMLAHKTKARRAGLHRAKQWALARNWHFIERSDTLTDGWMIGDLGAGGGQVAFGVATGQFDGLSMCTFNSQRVISAGKSSNVEEFTVAAVALPVRLPWLTLKPASRPGRRDLTFESPEFNSRWKVTSPSGRFGYDFLSPRMMERLSHADSLDVTISVQGSNLVLVREGKAPLEVRDAWFRLLADLVELVPPFVWTSFGAPRPQVDESGPGVSPAEQWHRIAGMQAWDQQQKLQQRQRRKLS